MNYKIVLALFLISVALTQDIKRYNQEENLPDMALAQTGNELRCQCINTHSKFIPPRWIQDVKLTQSGPHCQNVEVIATLNNDKEICLEPTAPWVKLIIKAILSKAEANNEISL